MRITENLAMKQEEELHAFQEFGHIADLQGNTFMVETPSGRYSAKKAASCLLCPELGSRVLMVGDPTGDCYILAVLEFGKSKKHSIHFDGDTELIAKNGQLHIAAQKGIDLTTVEDVNLVSSKMKVHTNHADISISRLVYMGSTLFSQIDTIKTLASTVDATIKRLTQKLTRSYRTVEEEERVQAGQIDYSAEKTFSAHGKYSLVTAKKDVKIDGKMIHMG